LLPETSFFPPIGQPFIVLASIDSSNNYAMAQVRAGMATAGTVYLAMEQTHGRGQRGKSWVANPGENIMISVVLQPKWLITGNPFGLSATAALGCYDFFKNLAGDDSTRIKWPNDLYWQDRKAGGILIETLSAETGPPEPKFAIIGIGINVNQTTFDPGLPNPVSLKQITGRQWDVLELARELCACLQKRYEELEDGHLAQITTDYNNALFKRHQAVHLKKDSAVFETIIQGVSPDGKLMTKDVVERTFNFGEIEWLVGRRDE